MSNLNQNEETAWLFFIALPYSIREIESRCPQYNSRQTPGRSYWDQTQIADNCFLLNPYVTWTHLYDPAWNHGFIKYALWSVYSQGYEIRDELHWFRLNFSFHVKKKKTPETLIQEADKKIQTNCMTAMQHRPQVICLNSFLKCQGTLFHWLVLFLLDLSWTTLHLSLRGEYSLSNELHNTQTSCRVNSKPMTKKRPDFL